MSFTLNLGFGGLCLFVPEHDAQGKLVRMSVLLPPFEPCEVHEQVLTYDADATQENQPHTGKVAVSKPFSNQEFDLSGVAETPALQLPPQQVPDLTSLFSATVPKQYLSNSNTGGVVASRVRFDAGTSVLACGAMGDFWFFPDFGTSVRLPIRVIWSLQIDDTRLVIQTIGMNGESDSQKIELYPSSQGVLDLWVFNSPSAQIPNKLPPLTSQNPFGVKDPACHFAAFYKVTDATFPLPVYDHQAPAVPKECFEDETGPGLDVTCIGAQAQPRP